MRSKRSRQWRKRKQAQESAARLRGELKPWQIPLSEQAKGVALESIAAVSGIVRMPGEPDDAFRERVRICVEGR